MPLSLPPPHLMKPCYSSRSNGAHNTIIIKKLLCHTAEYIMPSLALFQITVKKAGGAQAARTHPKLCPLFINASVVVSVTLATGEGVDP